MALSLDSPGFRDSLVILGGAGLVIPAFARFRINPVIGFILVGLLAGPSGLGALADHHPWLALVTISDRAAIEPFAELGIILLLFAIGLELSFPRLWSMRRLVFGLGAAELLLSALVIAVALALLGQPAAGAGGIGVALALSSTALVLPITGMRGSVGTPAFAMLLFEDLALVPIIFALGALGPDANGGVAALMTTLATGVATVAVMLLAGRFVLPAVFAQAARTKNPELFLAISLLTVILASLATSAAGLSPIVGALVAGLLIAETEYRVEVEMTTAPLRGLALGVFLITIGMSLDLGAILANWAQLLLALLGVVLAKAIVTGLLLRVAGGGRAVAAEAGLLMASPSETTLIVLGVAADAALIQPTTAAFWQMVTAIGMTITPALAWAGRAAARQVARGELDTAPDEKPVAGRAVIVGFGRVGRLVAQMLAEHGRAYLAVEANIDVVRQAIADGEPILFGDVVRAAMIERLDLDHAGALVLTMDDPVQAVRLTQRVRARFPALTIVARARDAGHAAELYRAGATDAVPETLEASLQLSEAVLVDLGVAMGPVIASIHEKRAEKRTEIMTLGRLDREPRLRPRVIGEIDEGS